MKAFCGGELVTHPFTPDHLLVTETLPISSSSFQSRPRIQILGCPVSPLALLTYGPLHLSPPSLSNLLPLPLPNQTLPMLAWPSPFQSSMILSSPGSKHTTSTIRPQWRESKSEQIFYCFLSSFTNSFSGFLFALYHPSIEQ